MKIDLTEIYKGLAEWRAERGITAESQKAGYLVNVMEELGELATALRDYEKFSATDYPYPTDKQEAEHEIIDALCDIAIFTINAGVDIGEVKRTEIELKKSSLDADYILKQMVERCAFLSYFEWREAKSFNIILANCAYLCEHYGYNFEVAMLETIKEISSRTGTYNEASKKWVKDTSVEAKAKWYKADYEKARIAQWIKYFKNGDKEQLKLVLKMVYKCKNVEQMSDDELAFCYIAKTLESLENFCELVESAETTLESRIIGLDERLKKLEKRLENELSE